MQKRFGTRLSSKEINDTVNIGQPPRSTNWTGRVDHLLLFSLSALYGCHSVLVEGGGQ